MADPLSVTASVVGLISLADIVFRRTYKYVRAAAKADGEILALSSELGSLHGILCSLQPVVTQLEEEEPELTARVAHISACEKTLQKCRTILERDQTHTSDEKWRDLKRKLRWPFKSDEVKALIGEIQRHKMTLSLALQADGTRSLLQVLSGQQDLADGLNNIQNEIRLKREIDRRVILEAADEKMLSQLGKIDHHRSHVANRRLRQRGTGSWLIEHDIFKKWWWSQRDLLWLYGIPGAGKTILASLVIDELIAVCTPTHAVAYFYCDYRDVKTQEPHAILGSLIQQIAKQNEDSLIKLRHFYKENGQERHDPRSYEIESLTDLLLDMMSHFERTTIVIDALDECLDHVDEMLDVLQSFSTNDESRNIRLLLLSRDETDIRLSLEDALQISVAAENSDLRLYVASEIEQRTEKKKLNIVTSSLKDLIVERLISGAEGMFRWVTCQIDHLCELPHDAARRKALDNLPRGIKATYERILQRIMTKDAETQKIARRALKYIFVGDNWGPTAEEICRAVSIESTDRVFNVEAVPSEEFILRICGSLIRRSSTDRTFEFAHFTVKEFLVQIDSGQDSAFAAFKMNRPDIRQSLSKLSLKYLNMQQCDQIQTLGNYDGDINDYLHDFTVRLVREEDWSEMVEDWQDEELFGLMKDLFDPNKTRAFVAWAQEFVIEVHLRDCNFGEMKAKKCYWFDAVCGSVSTLHFAAWLGIPEICQWLLLDRNSDVHRSSTGGHPLHWLLNTNNSLRRMRNNSEAQRSSEADTARYFETLDVLIAAGADVNGSFPFQGQTVSAVCRALEAPAPVQTLARLIERGGQGYAKSLQRFCDDERDFHHRNDCERLVKSLDLDDSLSESQRISLKIQVLGLCDTKSTIKDGFSVKSTTNADPLSTADKRDLETSMRRAALYGQGDVVEYLIKTYGLNVNAISSDEGQVAAHFASKNDHVAVLSMLVSHGADLTVSDNSGLSALHYSVIAPGTNCLEFLLNFGADANQEDKEGMTAWHLAVEETTSDALRTLARSQTIGWSRDGKIEQASLRSSILKHAIEHGNVDHLSSLIEAGCDIFELSTTKISLLHDAAESSSAEICQFLIDEGLDVAAVSDDGSTPLHRATSSEYSNRGRIVLLLLKAGSDAFLANSNGLTPLELWIRVEIEYDDPSEEGSEVNDDEDLRKDKSDILRLLIDSTERTSDKDEALIQILFSLCRSILDDTLWQNEALIEILKYGISLTARNEADEQILDVLLKTWLEHYTKPRYREMAPKVRKIVHATEIIHTVLDYTPKHALSSLTHDLSSVLALTLWFRDSELALKLLEFSPNVDDIPKYNHRDLEPIYYVGHPKLSIELSRQLLQKSKALSDVTQASWLLNNIAHHGKVDIVNILFEAGVNLNGCDKNGRTALNAAARAERLLMVRWLVDHGANLNAVDKNGYSVAHQACITGNMDIIRYLKTTSLSWQARIPTLRYKNEDFKGLRMIHVAALHGMTAAMDFLHEEGLETNLDCTTGEGDTSLHLAVFAKHSQIVRWLLQHSASADLLSDYNGMSPLHMCARNGGSDLYELFEEFGCNMEGKDSEGQTCEVIAFENGHSELAKRIAIATGSTATDDRTSRSDFVSRLKLAIDLEDLSLCQELGIVPPQAQNDFQRTFGDTILSYCASNNKATVALDLLRRGVHDVRTAGGYTLGHFAVKWKNAELLKAILECGLATCVYDAQQISMIHIAAFKSSHECLTVLLEFFGQNSTSSGRLGPRSLGEEKRARGEVDCQCSSSAAVGIHLPQPPRDWEPPQKLGIKQLKYRALYTPLHLAAEEGNTEGVKQLLHAGACVHAFTPSSSTALHLASSRGHISTIKLLLDFGAERNALDRLLKTPAMCGASQGHLEVIKLLVETTADIVHLTVYHETFLHMAAYSDNVLILAFALEHVSDRNIWAQQGVSGDTALDEAFNCMALDKAASFLLNLDIPSTVYDLGCYNLLRITLCNESVTSRVLKMLLRKFSASALWRALRSRTGNTLQNEGTPLYLASTVIDPTKQAGIVGLLLDVGAPIDQDGGRYGSPLIAACYAGRLAAVKVLILRGARTSLTRDGKTTTCLAAAQRHPGIVYWLLTGRFKERPWRLEGP